MPIVALIEEPPPVPQEQLPAEGLIFLAAAVAVSLLIAWAAGVFRRRSIYGPERIPPGQSPWALLVIMMAAVVTWMLVPNFYIVARQQWMPQPPPEQQEIEQDSPPQLAAIDPPTELPDDVEPADRPDPFTQSERIAVSTVASVAAFIILIGGNILYRPEGLRYMGFGGAWLLPGMLRGVLGIVIIFFPMLLAAYGTAQVWQALNLEHPPAHEALEALEEHRGQPAMVALVVFAAVVVAPLFEELLFRGHLQTLLRYTIGRPWIAVGVSSVLFTIVHPWWTWPPIFLLSLCIGYAYERTGNLWAAVVMHALFNGLMTLGFLYLMQQN